jgi:predicted RNase H-like nuclease (RuvC/YqgF family)
MSRSKLKKTINNLKTYLASDTHGQDLLDGVARSAHELRLEVAEKDSRLEVIEQSVGRIRNERDDARRDVDELRAEVERLKGQLTSQRNKTALLEVKIKREEQRESETLEGDEDVTIERLCVWTKQMQKEFKKQPKPSRVYESSNGTQSEKVLEYHYTQLMRRLDARSFEMLGRFVIWHAIAGLGYRLSVVSGVVLKDLKVDHLTNKQWQSKCGPIVRFMKDQIDWRSDDQHLEAYGISMNQDDAADVED